MVYAVRCTKESKHLQALLPARHLGRIHKDLWQEALAAGRAIEARGHLKRAIDAYVMGFQADWRDAYPGVNAVTLLDVEGEGYQPGAEGPAASGRALRRRSTHRWEPS